VDYVNNFGQELGENRIMKLASTPDCERAKLVWGHYWAGEVFKRPPVVASIHKPGKRPINVKQYCPVKIRKAS
jgi:hypothetical protein